MPLMPGSSRSSSTSCGLNATICSTPLSPSPAVPTTVSSGKVESTFTRFFRSWGWSSTTKIRVGSIASLLPEITADGRDLSRVDGEQLGVLLLGADRLDGDLPHPGEHRQPGDRSLAADAA